MEFKKSLSSTSLDKSMDIFYLFNNNYFFKFLINMQNVFINTPYYFNSLIRRFATPKHLIHETNHVTIYRIVFSVNI